MRGFIQSKIIFTLLLIISVSLPFLGSAAIFTVSINTEAALNVAVTSANTTPGKDTIKFNILPAGAYSIILTNLINVSEDIFIDGTTQPGYDVLDPKPMIELYGSPNLGIQINSGVSALGSKIKGLAINRCNDGGINLFSSNNIIEGCIIGLDINGISKSANNHGIIFQSTSSNNIIGGTSLDKKNIISGNNAHGLLLLAGSSNNFIIGNLIGTDVTGLLDMGNANMGIQVDNSNNNQIGGTTSDSMNIITFNNQYGIQILGSNSNRVIGNVISSNVQVGIAIANSAKTIIKSNLIGTSADGLVAKGNGGHGVQIQNSRETIIGGNHTTEGNIISASGGHGINLDPGSNKSIIKGNFIGTDISGTANFGNGVIGAVIKSDSLTIGGLSNDEGNIISGSKLLCGLLLANASHNQVIGNLIGTTIDTLPLGNKQDGINISVEDPGQKAIQNIINYNVIAYNEDNGINVGAALNNNISNLEYENNLRYNSIFCNQKLGIYLKLTNTNDYGNNGKPSPIINTLQSNTSTIVGIPNGLSTTDVIDIYEMTDCQNCTYNPQGKKYITSVNPDASGNWSYDNGSPLSGTMVAMVTDVNGNSSQFGICYTPCGINIAATSSATVVDLNPSPEKTVNFTSTTTGSSLSPLPLQHFWAINAPDTTGSNLYSTNVNTAITFNSASSGSNYGPGVYKVYLVAKQGGCIDTLSFDVTAFYIPNLVTPNSDNKNDKWAVSDNADLFEARIYNRWGELVFHKEGYKDEWDMSQTNDGIYFYQLKDMTGAGSSYKGWVQVTK